MPRIATVATHILVCLFGLGSWIAINGLWMELPLLVMRLPEGWQLGAYLAVIIQLANIGPIAFTLSSVFLPRFANEKVVAYVIICIGITACLLLTHFWHYTSYIAGTLHSTALFVLQFFLALVDCTSSVVFLPYMCIMKEEYLLTYYIGEGLSGLLPSIVAMLQGVGAVECVNSTSPHNISNYSTPHVIATSNRTVVVPKYLPPLFSIEDFFYFLFAMMIVCGVSFTLLNNLRACKNERVPVPPTSSSDVLLPKSTDGLPNATEEIPIGNRSKSKIRNDVHLQSNYTVSTIVDTRHKLSKLAFIGLLLLILVINAVANGVLPSVQSYSCLPYGNKPYHYAVTLSSIANPVACFFAFFVPVTSKSKLSCITTAGMCIAAYIVAMAALSPEPLLVDKISGSILIVCAWVVVTFLLTYSKVNIAMLFRRDGRQALLWCGACTQLGSAIGAIILFVVVSVLKLFTSANTC